MPKERKRFGFAFVHLVPFAALFAVGVTLLWGRPEESTDAIKAGTSSVVFAAYPGLCAMLLGIAPIVFALGGKRTGTMLSVAAALLAGLGLLQAPTVLSVLFLLTGLSLAAFGDRTGRSPGPILLSFLGSLAAAYGLTGLVADRTDLNSLELWQTYARLAPSGAAIVILLGIALIALAARNDTDSRRGGPSWLWLPVVACGVTVTLILWLALREREIAFANSTRQLTRHYLAEMTLFAGLGASCLLGVVINLAQAYRRRQIEAEETSERLRIEIEERRLVENRLRLSEAESRKLSIVARNTDNAVIITDPAGRIEWVNGSYTRLTGRSLEGVAGRALVELLASPEGDSSTLDRVDTALRKREPIKADVVQTSESGARFHVHLDVQPVFNETGSVEKFIAIQIDIGTRVETEKQLRRAKAEADDISRAKSEFLASMSHEIRTPMNGVIGMTSLLLETQLTPEQRDFVSTIRTSGDSLLAIINEILDFSRVESGRMELDHQPFEVTHCVEEVVDIFVRPAAAKNIELAYSIDAAVPRCVIGDVSRLRQVLHNLVNNAVKFTARGFITIEVRTTALAGAEPGQKVQLDFFVTDTGIGIPPEHFGQLFKPFTQVDSSNTRKYGGTGLGLAMCDRLCQLMGGSIEVTSVPGEGSCFHFSVKPGFVVEEGAGATTLPAIPGGGVVLAVDDLRVNRTMLATSLNGWQMQSLVASNPADALALAANGPLTTAIIDSDLGAAASSELVSALRGLHPHLPIILLTPANEEPRRGESNFGLIFRLPKPIKLHILHDALRHAILGGNRTDTDPGMLSGLSIRLGDSIPLDILLVEDNPVNQKVALRFLQRMGYRADAVANGLQAVDAVSKHDYKLVLMDVQMPEMDGFAATREIRARIEPSRQPVIIALTANAMQGDRERCLEAGMNDYITKPVRMDDIEQIVRRFFDFRAQGSQTAL